MAIDGLISGLKTSDLIEQLMSVERVPLDIMSARRDAARAAVDAFASVKTKLSAIATAASALERSSGWNLRKATSSDPAVATVAAAQGAALGSFTFTVDGLAATHGVATQTNVAATTSSVASGPDITLTVGGDAHTVSVGGGTLAEVVTAINTAAVGVRAAAVNTGSGYRLQLTATNSGADAAFTVSGLSVATAVTTQGADARLTFGSGPGAYQVTSATNTFSDVVPGVTVVAKAVNASPVTVDVASNGEGIADKIQALVDAVNAAKSEIATRTAYDPTSKKAASLAGDSAIRRANQELSRAVSDAVSQSALGSPGMAGVGLDRFGKVTFDREKFLGAYASNPTATEQLFAQHATVTGDMTFVAGGARAVSGSRDVVVTQAAAQASEVGMIGGFPITTPATIRVRIGSTEVLFAATPPMTATEVRDGLQAAIDAQDLDLSVSEAGGGLELRTSNYGANARFEVDWGTGTYHTVTGTDVAGTIGGVTAVGTGRQLAVPATDGTHGGITVNLTSDATGTIGAIDYEPGLAARLAAAVTAATDSTSGYLIGAQDGRQSRVDLLDRSISAYDQRLSLREQRLRKEFANLETSLSNIQGQASFLTNQLNSLSASSS